MSALLALLLSSALALDPPEPLQVEPGDRESLTFTRLVLSGEYGEIVATSTEAARLRYLERLREAGYNVKGGENLLFGKDEAAGARYVLAGAVQGFECERNQRSLLECEMQVEWQVLDARRDDVVYRTTTRGYAWRDDWFYQPDAELVQLALDRAFDSLLSRRSFADLSVSAGEDEAGWEEELAVRRCDAPALSLPDQLEEAMDAAVIVRSDLGTGSGVLISPDGFALTAAHVVEEGAQVDVLLRSGVSLPGTVLRTDPIHDVAILSVSGSGFTCARLAEGDPRIGQDLYAVGAPGGQGLEFSVAKGVVSGLRSFEDVRFIQTDASINAGNSGGPLFGEDGAVVAVVSWKIAAPGFEGLGFGAPASSALAQLGVEVAEASTESPTAERRAVEVVEDPPDESQLGAIVAELYPPKPPKPPKPPRPPIPDWKKRVWVGGTAAGVGAGMVVGTWIYVLQDPEVDMEQWRGLQAANAGGWGLAAVGAGLVTWGVLTRGGEAADVEVVVRPGGAGVRGRF